MSTKILQKSPICAKSSAQPDNLSTQISSLQHVVKCLSCGAYYRGANIMIGALSLVRHITDARKFPAKTAVEVLAFLRLEYPGFAWAVVPFGGAQ